MNNVAASVEPKSFGMLLDEAAKDYAKEEREKQNEVSNEVHANALLFNDDGGDELKALVSGTSKHNESISKNPVSKKALADLKKLLKKPSFDGAKA